MGKTAEKNPEKLLTHVREGYAFNPLIRYPRNEICCCGSEKKFKKCCLPKILDARICTKENAEKLEQYLAARGF